MQRVSTALLLALLLGVAAASRVSYTGHKVIRIHNAESVLFDTLYALHFDVWSHSGTSEMDVRVDDFQLKIIQAMGLSYSVLIEDVGTLIENEEKAIAANKENDDFFISYHKYDEILAYFKTLATTYSDKVTFIPTVGKSIQGADLFGIRISTSKADDKPIIWYNGGQHAREWVSISTVSWIATQLLEQYGKN